MPPVTRGGLVPAKITNLSTNEVVNFMFNPNEYSLRKSNSWDKKNIVGQNIPQVTFSQGGAMSLSLKLHFDTFTEKTDVQIHTNTLWKMMMIDRTKEDTESGKSSPPPVAFSWGSLYFKAIIVSMTQKFTLFNSQGIPLRCEVDISLEQFLDTEDIQSQIPGQSASTGAPTSEMVVEGDRLDHVAARTTGDPSNHRQIAEQNNIDNPLKPQTGKPVQV